MKTIGEDKKLKCIFICMKGMEEAGISGEIPALSRRLLGYAPVICVQEWEDFPENVLGEWEKIYGYKKDEILILSCMDDWVRDRKHLEAAFAACGPGRGKDFSGADMVLEGLEEVDYELLNRIYQRRHGIPWTILTTRRCIIKEMEVQDLDELYGLYREKGVAEWVEPLFEREREEEYTKAYIRNMYGYYGFGMWLVREKYTGELIGRAGLNLFEFRGEEVLELGYIIGAPFQRNGYAKEVCTGLIQNIKTLAPGYPKLEGFALPGNLPSKKLLEALGFQYCTKVLREGTQMDRYCLFL